jgi:uncharacterized membrane protein
MFVGAIVAVVFIVTALGGSRLSRRWVIGMYTLLTGALLAIGYFYLVK